MIEDHADTRHFLRQMLEPLGAHVLLAEEGGTALELLRTQPALPHVILCDLLMPGMDGLAFTRELHRNPRLASIPVIAVTALGQLADYITTWTHGFQAHLSKPIEPEQLVEVIRRVVPSRRPRPSEPTDPR